MISLPSEYELKNYLRNIAEINVLPIEKIEFDKIIIRSLERPDGLIRLNSDGACSIGYEILQEVGAHTPVWKPSEITPSQFLSLMRKKSEKYVLIA